MTKVAEWHVVNEVDHKAGSFRRVKDVVFELPDGRRDTFTIKCDGTPVCILPITTDKRVVLARQFRPGPRRVLDELPGGGREVGETNAQAAARELLEETGYRAGQLISLGFPLECGYSDVQREGFVALGCVKVAEPTPDPGEFIDVVLKTIPEFFSQLVRGECTDPEIGWMGLHAIDAIRLVP